MVPKILHQIAPRDRQKWHPLWERCWPTWSKHFPDHQHRLWSDDHDIDSLVRDHFPEYWSVYKDFPFHIMRIDFAKLCILYQHGGIYSDMDVFCYENFESELKGAVCLLECLGRENYRALGRLDLEEVENSLIACEPNHPFIRHCLDTVIEKMSYVRQTFWPNNDIRFGIIGSAKDNFNARMIEEITGSYMIKHVYDDYIDKTDFHILNRHLFTNLRNYEHDRNYKTLHLYTALWGQDMMKFLEDDGVIDPNMPIKEKMDSYFFHGYKDKDFMREFLETILERGSRV